METTDGHAKMGNPLEQLALKLVTVQQEQVGHPSGLAACVYRMPP